nr:unnamed protein product [Callosobruchus chinensis]
MFGTVHYGNHVCLEIIINLSLQVDNSRRTENRFTVIASHKCIDILQSESGYDQFKNFTRMTKTDFEFLLNLITPKIMRKDTNFIRAISLRERLVLFLATGDSYSSLQYLFKVSKSSISHIVPDVCQAIES